jgi:hypothetical protein
VTPLGLGIWQWGDTMTWEFGKGYGEADLRQIYEATLAAVHTCGYCMPYENNRPIFVGRGLKVRLSEIWPREKRFI